MQRTMRGIDDLFEPIEQAICNTLIPAICGRPVSDLERTLLALPYRHGGLDIRNPVESASNAYKASVRITQPLADLIVAQNMNLLELDRERVQTIKTQVAAESEKALITKREEIAAALDPKSKRLLECAQEKRASSWLSALPLKRLGYTMNKQEFRDALCLQYGWKIPDMPTHCGSGAVNSVDQIPHL